MSFDFAAVFGGSIVARKQGWPPVEFPGIFHPAQLWVLTELLERHCEAADIKPGTQAYEAESERIIALYGKGARTIYELLAGLDEDRP